MWVYLLYGFLTFSLVVNVLRLGVGIRLILQGRQTDNLGESARGYLLRGVMYS